MSSNRTRSSLCICVCLQGAAVLTLYLCVFTGCCRTVAAVGRLLGVTPAAHRRLTRPPRARSRPRGAVPNAHRAATARRLPAANPGVPAAAQSHQPAKWIPPTASGSSQNLPPSRKSPKRVPAASSGPPEGLPAAPGRASQGLPAARHRPAPELPASADQAAEQVPAAGAGQLVPAASCMRSTGAPTVML